MTSRRLAAGLFAIALVTGACSSGAPAAPAPPAPTAPAALAAPATSNTNNTQPVAPAPLAPAHVAPAPSEPSIVTPVPPRPHAAAASTVASKKKCPSDIADGWTCVTLTVPLDHFTDIGRTIDVTFALQRHTGSGLAKGAWVTITGGPGSAGIYSAVDYTDTFAASVRRDYDLVFMDQRGSGMSGGFTCPDATLEYYTTEAGPADPDGGVALMQAAHTYVDDCLAESGVDQTILPYLATKQAVEDLEAFRLWLGVDKLDLYGESYGTQYVQTYAAAHPDHVKRLFLDGPVDLAIDGPPYYVEGAEAFEQALLGTLLDCTVQEECSLDVDGGNELTAYDKMAAQLEAGPISYTYTYADGHEEQRQFTASDLETAASGSLNNLSGRRLFQRAMAPASHGDVWWLARLAAGGVVENPDTHEPILDPSWSDALYYGVECVDYAYFPDAATPDERAQEFIDYGRDSGAYERRLPGAFTTDLPCAYWPVLPGPDPRPVPSPDAPYPLIVMGSTTDVATPFPNAERIVAARGDNPNGTWLIYWPGGPHVIFGRYLSCPDEAVTRMLVKNVYPDEHTLTCPGDLVADYVQTPDPVQIADGGPIALMDRYDDEINYGVDYWWWDYSDTLKFGCAFGGTIEYTPTARGSRLVLDSCSFVGGSRATGSGFIDDISGAFRLRLNFTGDWHGHARYQRAPSGHQAITGNVAYTPPD